jgi:hypothetical protein
MIVNRPLRRVWRRGGWKGGDRRTLWGKGRNKRQSVKVLVCFGCFSKSVGVIVASDTRGGSELFVGLEEGCQRLGVEGMSFGRPFWHSLAVRWPNLGTVEHWQGHGWEVGFELNPASLRWEYYGRFCHGEDGARCWTASLTLTSFQMDAMVLVGGEMEAGRKHVCGSTNSLCNDVEQGRHAFPATSKRIPISPRPWESTLAGKLTDRA